MLARHEELGEAHDKVRRVAAAARVVAERLRADASAAEERDGSAPAVRLADSGAGVVTGQRRRPGDNPRNPPIERQKPLEGAGLSASTNAALVEHLTADVGLAAEIALRYASALDASGHTTVDDFASLSLQYLQAKLGIKPGHTKRIQQYRQQQMLQTQLDHHGTSLAPSQRQARRSLPGLSPTQGSPTVSDYENYMLAAVQREQGFEKELMSLRDDLGAVLGELTTLKASHAELKERQRESVTNDPNPGPEPTPVPAGGGRIHYGIDEMPAPAGELSLPPGACDGDDPNEEKLEKAWLEQVWLEVDTQRAGSLTERQVANVLHRLGMVRNNSSQLIATCAAKC
eukprot:COSAG02_NODE_3766_length_6268_cov_9.545145_6_plen_344_part_00